MRQFFKGVGLRILVAAAAIAMFVSAHAEVPSQLVPPEGNVEFMRVYATGVQQYVSVANPARPGTYMWQLVGPSALLFDENGQAIGTHYAGPTWRYDEDGSSVKGTKISGVTVNPKAIDWLLLEARDWDGYGWFSYVSYIQRIDTVGGIPPFNPTAPNIKFNVKYSATYVFFTYPR